MEPYQDNNKHKDRNIFNDRNDKCQSHKNKQGNKINIWKNFFHPRSATLKPPSRTPAKEKAMTTPDEGFKAVKNALKHFLTVIGNNKLEVLPVLPGNGTIILESVSKVHELVTAGPGINCQSSNVQSTLSHVYQSVANLIQFCDDYALYNSNNNVLFHNNEEVDEEEKQQMAAEFQKVVKEAESNVREVSEAMKSLEQLVPSNSRWFQTSLPEINTEQDSDISDHLDSSYVYRRNKSLECLGVYSSTPSPPSKPPYERNNCEHPLAAPPVPPKKKFNPNNALSMERLSLGSQGESDFSSLQEYDYRDSLDGTNSPHLNRSTQYSYSSSHSSSSQHFIINSTQTQSTLNSIVNQQFNMNQHVSSGTSLMVESWELTPPPLPKKERLGPRKRNDSQYDNVPDYDSDFESDVPPPLPPKKRHISDYMKVFGPSRLESFHSDPTTCVRDMFLHQQSHHMTQQSMWSYNSTASYQSDFQAQSFCSRSIGSSYLYGDDINGESIYPLAPINGEILDPDAPPLPPKTRNPPGSHPVYLNQNNNVHEENDEICRPEKTIQQDKMSQADNKALLENLPDCTIEFIKLLDVREHLIFTEDGNDVRGAHPDALLVHATRDNNKYLFQDIYLTTYRTFTTPLDIIVKLIDRYNTFNISAEVHNQRAANESFSFLKRTVRELTIHELETNLGKLLKDFIYKLISIGHLDAAKNLRQIMVEKYACKNKDSKPNPLLTSRNVTTSQKTLLDFKPELLAETMTLLDSELFVKIEIPEVLSWIQHPDQQDEEKSPNLVKFTKHFNNVSYWARTQILNQRPAALRENYITKFIKIMDHLKTLNNFNSFLALVAALSSAPIKRLQSYKNKNTTVSDMVAPHCALIDSTSSFKAYRQTLAEVKPPCIPYIGLVLQDLTFVQMGNPKLLTYHELPENIKYKNVINFSMRQCQFKILQNMKRFQNDKHVFGRQERMEIIELFDDFEDFLQEESMWGLSEEIQPRKPTTQHTN